MRLSIFLFLMALLHTGSRCVAQNITLSVSKTPLEKVFEQVKSQTGYLFLYDAADLEGLKTVTISVSNIPINTFMQTILKDHPLQYKIRQKNVVISRKVVKPSTLSSLSNDTLIDVRGRVVDERGDPLIRATVTIKGTTKATLTDEWGNFVLRGVGARSVVKVSSVGFEMKEVKAGKELVVVLGMSAEKLEDVEVMYSTGYQDIPKERATGSFVQLNNKDISRTVSTNILDRIAYITNSLRKGGNESGDTDISIRGLSTINASRRPLIIVDGFPYEETSGFVTEININNINPNDVESITILRDAAAASIWGARAANGVIVITTKKGRFNQKSNIQFTSNINLVERPDLFKVNIMSSRDVIEFEKQLFAKGLYDSYNGPFSSTYNYPVVSPAVEIMLAEKRGAITKKEADAALNELSNHDVRNDINKYLLRRSINQQYNLNISGGSNKMNYYGSIGYDKIIGSSIGNQNSRLTLNLNNTYRPIRKIELNTYIVYTQSEIQNNGLNYSDYLANGQTQAAPYAMLADANGNPLHANKSGVLRTAYIDTLKIAGLLDWHYRPIEEIRNNDNNTKLFNIRLGGGLKYTVFEGLDMNISGQYERALTNTDNFYSTDNFVTRNLINRFMFLDIIGRPQYPVPLGGILDYSTQVYTAYNLRGQLNFNKTWAKHAISSIAGADIREAQIDYNQSRKYGYDPLTLTYATNMDYKNVYTLRPSGNGLISMADDLTGRLNRFISYYTNIGYTAFNKYTVTASARIDASNFLGIKANLKAVPLWSLGAGWDITKEAFFQSNIISSLKLRVTYGFNGNLDNTATSLPTISYSNGSSQYNNGQQFAIRSSNPPNPGLTWEKLKVINWGIDFSVLNNRINGAIEYYTKKSENLISSIPVDETVGVAQYIGNVGGLRGKGIDLLVNALILNKKLKFNTVLSFSYTTNEVTEYYLSNSSYNNASAYISGNIREGKPIGHLYAYKWGGLNSTNGDPMGVVDGKIVPFATALNDNFSKPEDLIYVGQSASPFFGNILNTFSLKGFSVSCNFIYRFGYFFRRPSIDYNIIQTRWSGHGDYALRWQKTGDELVTNVPSLSSTFDSRYSFYKDTEVLIEKGDHIRLQDLRLSYDLNKFKAKLLPFRDASVFINANNLGIIVWKANNKGIDPLFFNNAVPIPRSIAFGLTLNY